MTMGVRIGPWIGPNITEAIGVINDKVIAQGQPGVVIAGQSNAESFGPYSGAVGAAVGLGVAFHPVQIVMTAGTVADPLVLNYYDGSVIHGGAGTANPPSTYGDVNIHFTPGINPDDFGPEITIARDLNSNGSPLVRIAKFTQAGSELQANWLPTANFPTSPANSPNLYTQFVNYIIQMGVKPAFVWWMQGENDAKNTGPANAYKTNMNAFWNAFFTTFPACPLIIGELSSSLIIGTYPFRDTVRAQQVSFAQQYPWCTIINNDDLGLVADSVHFSADSQATIGHRVYSAYAAAINTTTLSSVLGSSVSTVPADGTAYSYTVDINNTGTTAGLNVSAVVTLPIGVTYQSASGTGWTITQTGSVSRTTSQIVTATRASTATGAAPTITINVKAPTQLLGSSVVCTATVVANNVSTMASLTKSVTTTAPSFTIDIISGIAIPQTSTEWTNFISAKALTLAVPDALWLPDGVASGNISDAIGTFTMAASGTNGTYNTTISGWWTRAFNWINAATASFQNTDAGLPSINTNSLTILMLASVATPSATRGILGGGTSNFLQIQLDITPKIISADGANVANGAANPTSVGVQPYTFTHNKTGGTARVYTSQEKLAPVISASATGKKIILGGSGGVGTAPPMNMVYACAWFNTNAEISDVNMKALLVALGYAGTP